jgi:hypothetical protein
MINYQGFSGKIQALEAEIATITDRLTANSQEVERLKTEVGQAESDLFSAKKAYALDSSIGNKKAVSDLQKQATKFRAGVDDFQILDIALQEKRAGLEAELNSATDALRMAEVEELSSKAAAFIAEYEAAITAAHRAANYLKAIQIGIQTRKGEGYLRQVCPAAASLAFLPGEPFRLTKWEGHKGFNILYDETFDKKAIIRELLNTPDEPSVMGAEKVSSDERRPEDACMSLSGTTP